MVGFGRLFLPRILHFVSRADSAGSSSGELVLIASIAMAIGGAMLTGRLGFSPEMGEEFLAGFMLSFTPFRLQLAGQLGEPLRDLLMAVFFTAVGLEINPTVLASDWARIGLGLAVLLTFKTAVIALSAWALGSSASVALISGIYLAAGGRVQPGDSLRRGRVRNLQARARGRDRHCRALPRCFTAARAPTAQHVLAARVSWLRWWVRGSAMRTHRHRRPPGRAPAPSTLASGDEADRETQQTPGCGPVIIAGFGPVGRNLAERFAALRVHHPHRAELNHREADGPRSGVRSSTAT